MTGPTSSNSRKRGQIPANPIYQVEGRNPPRRRIVLPAGNQLPSRQVICLQTFEISCLDHKPVTTSGPRMTLGNPHRTRAANMTPNPHPTTPFGIQIGSRERPGCSELSPNPENTTKRPQTDRHPQNRPSTPTLTHSQCLSKRFSGDHRPTPDHKRNTKKDLTSGYQNPPGRSRAIRELSLIHI